MIAVISFARSLHSIAIALAALVCVTSALYYAASLYCARDFLRRPAERPRGFAPPISILKPVCGLDRAAYENFASFCRQRYPRFQILFGSDREDDPGLDVARRVAEDFPSVDIRIVVHRGERTNNPKVGSLAAMAAEARHPLLLVSDSDIRVGPEHLSRMVAPMADPGVGAVTCLYRSLGDGFAGTLDALGLATEFHPSVLLARRLEGISFGMGSGTLVQKSALEASGGFEAIADFLADDYLLGNLPVRAGYRAELASDVVDHELGTTSLRGVIDHQIRWNRGTRAVRPGGYAGLAVAQATPAALLLLVLAAASPAAWALSALALSTRLAAAWYVAVQVMEDPTARRAFWLVPLRDLFGFGLWLAGFGGDSVVWRGKRLRLGAGGRLAPALADDLPNAASELARTGIAS